jgi:putative membrane protein
MTAGVQTWIPYCGAAPLPADWLARWNLDPILLLALAAAGVGWHRWLRPDSAAGRAAFASAFALALLLFVSPFCALTSALFSARVVHHVALTAILAPLLVASVPVRKVGPVGSLAGWTGAQALIFWAWHSPDLYAWALSSDPAYWLMQLSLLAGAIGFWLAVRRASAPAAVGALLATMVQMGLLGALITFSASLRAASGEHDRLGADAARGPAACRAHHVGAGGGTLSRRSLVARWPLVRS